MSTQVRIEKNKLNPDSPSLFEAGEERIAVYEIRGVYYATQDSCTHAKASLSEGEILDGDLIECPVHGGTFHIPTGRAVDFPCERAIRTYRVTDEGDALLVDLAQEAACSAGLVERSS
ncbi:MAG: non-heme iron oxygenase ferredoxin subunit [Pusillimonas sp.]|nr:non-heme iron oxygenase ferredoxin subunit [Pusillimonas sp.]